MNIIRRKSWTRRVICVNLPIMGDRERSSGEVVCQHVRLLPFTEAARRGEQDLANARQPATRDQDESPLPRKAAPSEVRRSLWEKSRRSR